MVSERRKQHFELGEANRIFGPTNRGDQARQRPQSDLLRCRGQRHRVNGGIARLAHLAMQGEKVLGYRIERRPRPPETPGRKRHGLRGQAELGQHVGALPQTRAFKAHILIARVEDEREPLVFKGRHKPRLRHVEQWPEQCKPRPRASFWNGGKTIQPAAALKPHQEGLGLVI